MFKILIAEDDRELRQLFAHVLTKNGYTVLGVSNGEEALAALEQSYYDLIISDIMMPKMDGYELVRSIRESGSSIPIMMITAKDAFDDMRLGFLSGSDDYMVKPVDEEEMLLRIAALLRRSRIVADRRLNIGGTELNFNSMSVTVAGKTESLPKKEFLLLFKLLSYPGRIFTRRQLMDEIWDLDSESDERTVDVHIKRLREKGYIRVECCARDDRCKLLFPTEKGRQIQPFLDETTRKIQQQLYGCLSLQELDLLNRLQNKLLDNLSQLTQTKSKEVSNP